MEKWSKLIWWWECLLFVKLSVPQLNKPCFQCTFGSKYFAGTSWLFEEGQLKGTIRHNGICNAKVCTLYIDCKSKQACFWQEQDLCMEVHSKSSDWVQLQSIIDLRPSHNTASLLEVNNFSKEALPSAKVPPTVPPDVLKYVNNHLRYCLNSPSNASTLCMLNVHFLHLKSQVLPPNSSPQLLSEVFQIFVV